MSNDAANKDKEEKVSFIQYHEPPLTDGEYVISVRQDVSVYDFHDLSQIHGSFSDSTSKTIYVAGDRFNLEEKDIFTCFPPPGNTGDYSNALPHIALARSTHPWERRTGDGSGTDRGEATPWMWLFVFDDVDIAKGYVKKPVRKKLGDIFYPTGTSGPPEKIPISTEPGELRKPGVFADKSCDIIEINYDWLADIIPSSEEIQLLTSVRKNDINGVDTEHAICIANRMPQQGVRSYACLLSLEHRLETVEVNNVSKPIYTVQGVSNDFTSFVCLKQWSFSCIQDLFYNLSNAGKTKLDKTSVPKDLASTLKTINDSNLYTDTSSFVSEITSQLSADQQVEFTKNEKAILNCFEVPGQTFRGILMRLSSDSFSLDKWANTSSEAANQYLLRGAVALSHHLRDGGKTISWYHGPFQPSNDQSNEVLPPIVLSSDELLRYDSTLKMLDVSYSSAWELGRMMTLNNKSIAMDLYSWKRQQVWKKNQSNSNFYKALVANSNSPSKEELAVQSWCKNLLLLKNIPFNYLVPDERLLPNEAIRFFTINDLWLNCLLDGALSIGRMSETDKKKDASLLSQFGSPGDRPKSGFLIRSEVVSGWPHLMITVNGDDDGKNIVNRELLGPNILMILCNVEIEKVDIHLKPESLHFGFDVSYEGTDTQHYSKLEGLVPDVNGKWNYKIYKKPVQPQLNSRAVNIGSLKSDLKTATRISPFTSAQFALEMIKGVPNVTFSVEDKE